MKKILLILSLLLIITFSSCTSDNDFEKGKAQLEQQGYTNVVNTGYNPFCCSDKEGFSTGFECKNSKGEIVKGCFCSDFLKGITIRFE